MSILPIDYAAIVCYYIYALIEGRKRGAFKMKNLAEIIATNKDGDYYAIGNNGKQYTASYSAKFECMFFAIPASVEIIGYIER